MTEEISDTAPDGIESDIDLLEARAAKIMDSITDERMGPIEKGLTKSIEELERLLDDHDGVQMTEEIIQIGNGASITEVKQCHVCPLYYSDRQGWYCNHPEENEGKVIESWVKGELFPKLCPLKKRSILIKLEKK